MFLLIYKVWFAKTVAYMLCFDHGLMIMYFSGGFFFSSEVVEVCVFSTVRRNPTSFYFKAECIRVVFCKYAVYMTVAIIRDLYRLKALM